MTSCRKDLAPDGDIAMTWVFSPELVVYPSFFWVDVKVFISECDVFKSVTK